MERTRPHFEPPAERDPRLDEALRLLDHGLTQVMSEPGFRHFLEAQAQLYRYSPKNQLLIWAQRPDATLVNSFERWKKLGRWVNKGERGLKVFVPMLSQRVDPETGEREEILTGFRLGNVFDIAQTSGQPLPDAPRAEELAGASEQAGILYARTEAWLAGEGVAVEQHAIMRDWTGRPSTAKGYYLRGARRIGLQLGMSADQRVKTLVHEAGHYVADQRGFVIPEREDAETIAESASFVVCHRYGVNTADYSFRYVAGWAQQKERFVQNLGFIQSTARTILMGIETMVATDQSLE